MNLSIVLFTGKVIFLFLGIWWTIVNVGRIICHQNVPSMNVVLQTIGITGFVVIQFLL